jgi:hypothetical protein
MDQACAIQLFWVLLGPTIILTGLFVLLLGMGRDWLMGIDYERSKS